MPDKLEEFVCYDSLSKMYKNPVGAVAVGQEVTISVRLLKRSGTANPRLLIYAADEWETPMLILPMEMIGDELTQTWYSARYVPQHPQLLFYRFDVEAGKERRPIMRGHNLFEGRVGQWGGEHWQLTVYDPAKLSPPALCGGLIYQIFPDRFLNSGSKKENVPADRVLRTDWGGEPEWKPNENGEVLCNDYFGGDLKGVTQKLNYLESLGVTAIYFNPVFEAHTNHRYSTADYSKIDPLLGSEQDFKELCEKARQKGISVILDGVFSHTGSDSVYFNREGRYGENSGAYRDKTSPFVKWYKFDSYPENYKSWWGFETLPEINEENPDYLDFITGKNGVIDHWTELGAGGWRLDVADELPDKALDAICAAARRKNPEAVIIGEVWEDASNKVSYGERRKYLLGNQLSSVMNYPLTNAILAFVRDGDFYSLYQTLLTQRENYPLPILNCLMNSLSTHDIPRAITALAGERCAGAGRPWQQEHNKLTSQQYETGKQLLKLASFLQYLLPGTPCLYYGDEAGMCGYRDPFNRVCYPWGDEDAELIEWFTALGKVRREQRELLSDGEFLPVQVDNELFSFVRRGEYKTLFAAVNRGRVTATPVFPPDLNPTKAVVLMGDKNKTTLRPRSVMLLEY